MRAWSAIIPVFFLAACVTAPQVADWPDHLPPVSLYVAAWQDDAPNQQYQSLDDYLVWVRRFHQGFNIAPGWDDLTRQVMERIPEKDRDEVGRRLFELGRRLSVEWAKSNEERLIDTRMAAVWRDALQEALSLGDLDNYLDRVEADVAVILESKLEGGEIRFERYYVDELDF
jgi:hypothetical protein